MFLTPAVSYIRVRPVRLYRKPFARLLFRDYYSYFEVRNFTTSIKIEKNSPIFTYPHCKKKIKINNISVIIEVKKQSQYDLQAGSPQ